jgi:hypothetical protein
VNLPPGCSGITCADGTRYSGKKGGFVEVEDRHAKAIKQQFGVAGKMLSATGAVSMGTKKGRWCKNCVPPRLWNVWNETCPRCGQETDPAN